MIKISKNWFSILHEEFSKPYFLGLQQFLKQEYSTKKIYPKPENIFSALNMVKYEDVKVVIFGQDPYHQPGQAHGLCFSVQEGVKIPPSLVNIFKEIEDEFGYKCLTNGDLSRWAKQGVLLLNTSLTVEDSKPNSHKNKGWETFTSAVVKKLNERKEPIIFVMWGANAKVFEPLIDAEKHIILKSAHPSPLSAYQGFFKNGHFKKVNEILKQNNQTEIDWH